MKEYHQKWCVVSFLEPVPKDVNFHWEERPLHITLAGVFTINLTGVEIVRLLTGTLNDQRPLEVTAIDEDYWGDNKEFHVIKIEKSQLLAGLHMKILQELERNGAVFDDPQFQGNNYSPHSTVQKSASLHLGDSVTINSISLVDMFPGSDHTLRRITETISFS